MSQKMSVLLGAVGRSSPGAPVCPLRQPGMKAHFSYQSLECSPCVEQRRLSGCLAVTESAFVSANASCLDPPQQVLILYVVNGILGSTEISRGG